MARKTKAQKDTEENKGSEAPEVIEAAADEASPEPQENESTLTEEMSEQVDIDDSKTDTQENGEASTDEPADEIEVSDDSAESVDDELIDAEVVSDQTPTEEAEPEDPVPTEIAGVVPAAAEAKQVEAAVAPPPPPPPAKGPGVFPLLIGGAAAGAIGYFAAAFGPSETTNNGDMSAQFEALSGEVASLADRIEALPAPAEATDGAPVDLAPLTDRIGAVESASSTATQGLADLEQAIAALRADVDAIGDAPTIVAPDGSGAMEAQLETFRRELDAVTASARAEIEEAQARASAIEAEAAASAEAAARSAAIAEINAALESGAPFSGATATLGDAPEALTSVADDGVMTLADLQAGFPAMAREVLQGVQVVPQDASATDRLTAFLRRQTNARSLAPREGDDADAILSRAEAALSSGDLETALAELEMLPDNSKAVMQDWIDPATARAGAVAAMSELN